MCKACQSSVNGLRKRGKKRKPMARKRRNSRVSGLNTKDVGSVAQNWVLPGIAGAVAATYLDKLPYLDKHPQYVNYAAIAGGLALAVATKNPMAIAAGIGMAISGGAAVANDLLDGQGGPKTLGLLPPGVPSLRISGTPESQIQPNAEITVR
jgi:hypothetical protein